MSRFQEAMILRARHRPQEALRLLLSELAQYPDNGYLHFQICLTHLEIPKGERAALKSIRTAISLDPDSPEYIAFEAHVLNQLERHAEALKVANRALAMDADELMAWVSKSFAYCGMQIWDKMEENARQGLELYPDDEHLAHALTIALRMQGKLHESSLVAAERLQRNPDNDMNLANAGWIHIHTGQHKEAEEKFLAALRIDPQNEYARDGLREAYKSRSLIYRLYIKLCLRMARVPERLRTFVFLGMFFGYRFLAAAAEGIHPLLGGAVVILWMLFVFWAHVVNSVAHALLLKDPVARHTLNQREKWDGAITATLICLAIALAATGYALDLRGAIFAGILCFATLLCATHIALNRIAGMLVYGGITLFVCGCAGLTLMGVKGFFSLGLTVALLSTWLGLIPQLNKAANDD